jgi:bifunctional DNase/RNase
MGWPVQVSLSLTEFALDPRDGRAIVVLSHDETERVFPIWLEDRDAAAIARAAEGRPPARPDAQDLAFGVTLAVGARVVAARLTGVVKGVVCACVEIEHGDEPLLLEARPSDAIALALKGSAPILVDDELLERVAERVREAEARVRPDGAGVDESVFQTPGERWNQLLEHLSDAPRGPLYEA